MIPVIILLVLIAGLMAIDAIIEVLFVLIYLLAAVAVTNHTIEMKRYRKKYGCAESGHVRTIVLYTLMAAATAAIQFIFF